MAAEGARVSLAAFVDYWIADARRRLHKAIDVRTDIALGRKPETARRSAGQVYKRKDAKK
jgi:hypothetical protein